jgi:molybdate transport system substrate-binding protein
MFRHLSRSPKRTPLRLALVLLCAGSAFAVPARAAETLTVFAAASLKNALDEVVKSRRPQNEGSVRVSYAASPALSRQIENGAPADVFISADLAWMDYLQKKGLIRASSRVNLLRNRIVLVAPAGSTVKLTIAADFPLASALGKERLAMADPASVPAGRYGKAALESLGVWKSVESRIAAAADVRAALLLVARGEAPLGIVYSTDAAAEPKVRIVDTFPESAHPPIVYPAALTASGKSTRAGAFLASLLEPPARAVFDKHGFK